jgi:glycine oxidase
MSRIGIAGAGVVGRLLAWQLARLGHEVHVVDPAPGGGSPFAAHDTAQGVSPSPRQEAAAGFTAAGMLSPLAELESAPGEIATLGWRSLDLWPGIVGALSPEHRATSLFRRNGSVIVAHPQDVGAAARVLARMEAHARDLATELREARKDLDAALARSPMRMPQALASEALQTLEPALARGLHGWYLPGEGQVDAQALMTALCADAPNVQWHWGVHVDRVEPRRVRLPDGRALRCEIAFDTRGLGARPALPLRGVRGEILWLHAPRVSLRRPVRCVHPRHRVYLVPRRDDHIIVGATEIDSEDRSPVSVRSAIELLSAAHSIVPELAEARIVRMDTNLRPAMPDQRPTLQVEDGLVRINGLFRHGWLLAPALVEEALRQTGLNGENLAQALPSTVPSAPIVPMRPRTPRNAETNDA